MADDPYVMSPTEVVFGFPPGHSGTLAPPSSEAGARDALEQVLLASLQRPPCGVAFSGGRDSSLLLAVATHVARREGLADPVPITRVFPDVPRAEEHEWQELVVGHLGLADWERIELRDELDLVGPLATARLLEHGLVWPPPIHGDVPMLERVRGGSLVDGEGGDEVLGVGAHRISPMTALLVAPRPLRWRRVRRALGAVAPRPVRARHMRRRLDVNSLTWLQPAARELLYETVSRVELDQPLSFAASVRMVPLRRTQSLMLHNRRLFAGRYDVDLRSPLQHPDVVHALARDGGWRGRGDRTAVLRWMAGDLLPDAVLARTTKAEFGGAYLARHTREFAESWRGDGVDHTLVIADELQRLWLSGESVAPTAALLQAAWLGEHDARANSGNLDQNGREVSG